MPLFTNVNNVNKEIKEVATNVSGSVKKLDVLKTNVSGVNKDIFSSVVKGNQNYTSVGAYTFTVPSGVSEIRYEMSGGAGGRAGAYSAYTFAGNTATSGNFAVTASGLSSPAYGQSKTGTMNVSSGQSIKVVVGAKATTMYADDLDVGIGCVVAGTGGCFPTPDPCPPSPTYPSKAAYTTMDTSTESPTYFKGNVGTSGSPTSLGNIVANGGGAPNPAQIKATSNTNPVVLSRFCNASHSTSYSGSSGDGYVKLAWG